MEERVIELTSDSWIEYKAGAKALGSFEVPGGRFEIYEDSNGIFLHWLEQDSGGNFVYMVCRVTKV